MRFLNQVKGFAVLDGYRVRVTFRDGFTGTVDLWPLFEKQRGPLDEDFRDPGFFQKAFLDGHTLSWPNSYDICPDVLRFYCEIGRVCSQEELNTAFAAEGTAATEPMILKDKSN